MVSVLEKNCNNLYKCEDQRENNLLNENKTEAKEIIVC